MQILLFQLAARVSISFLKSPRHLYSVESFIENILLILITSLTLLTYYEPNIHKNLILLIDYLIYMGKVESIFKFFRWSMTISYDKTIAILLVNPFKIGYGWRLALIFIARAIREFSYDNYILLAWFIIIFKTFNLVFIIIM